MKKQDVTKSGYYWYRRLPLYTTWGIVEITFPNGELSGNLAGYLEDLAEEFEFVGPVFEPFTEITAAQQRELDVWVATRERMVQCHRYATEEENLAYMAGYNAGTAAAAEAVEQGNWTWEEYQEWKRKWGTG